MQLNIKVVEAKDLPKMDLFGKLDPYVVMLISNSQIVQKTSVIEKNYSPVWNESFKFMVKNTDAETITFMIKDKDNGNSDDAVSRLILKINSFPVGETVEKWYNCVPAPNVKKGGQLHLIIKLSEPTEKPFE